MSVSRRQVVLGSTLSLATFAATAHADVTINESGPGLRITVARDGELQVHRGPFAQLTGPGFVFTNGDQPMNVQLGSQNASGQGTEEDPFRVDTILVGFSGKVQLSVAYVAGSDAVDVSIQVWPYGETIGLYHLIDSLPNAVPTSFWDGDPEMPMALGLIQDGTTIELVRNEGMKWGSFYLGEAGVPAQQAAAALPLGNEVVAGEHHERSLGVHWSHGSEDWPEITYRLRFGGGVCGDGILAAGEACDDGNWVSGDHCTSSCTVPREDDLDDDHVEDSVDLCPGVPDFQTDVDGDGLGDACDPTDDREADLGGSTVPPSDPIDPDDGWGSDDVGPPPTGPNANPVEEGDPTITSDGDEDEYGSVTDGDADAAGCSAGGGGAGGGLLVLLGLAALCGRRRT